MNFWSAMVPCAALHQNGRHRGRPDPGYGVVGAARRGRRLPEKPLPAFHAFSPAGQAKRTEGEQLLTIRWQEEASAGDHELLPAALRRLTLGEAGVMLSRSDEARLGGRPGTPERCRKHGKA